jgi:hypothetical protein
MALRDSVAAAGSKKEMLGLADGPQNGPPVLDRKIEDR